MLQNRAAELRGVRKSLMKILCNYRAAEHTSSPKLVRQTNRVDPERDDTLTDNGFVRKTDHQSDRAYDYAQPHDNWIHLFSLRKQFDAICVYLSHRALNLSASDSVSCSVTGNDLRSVYDRASASHARLANTNPKVLLLVPFSSLTP